VVVQSLPQRKNQDYDYLASHTVQIGRMLNRALSKKPADFARHHIRQIIERLQQLYPGNTPEGWSPCSVGTDRNGICARRLEEARANRAASFVGTIASDDRDRGGACKAGEQKRQEFDAGFSPTQAQLRTRTKSKIVYAADLAPKIRVGTEWAK
jgi:hypothetical protein